MYLDSSIDNIDRLNRSGYTLERSDYPSITKRDDAVLYHRKHLQVIKMNGISSLRPSIVLEIRPQNIKCFLTSLYRSSIQNKGQFDEFGSDFCMLMLKINDEKPLASITTRDFIARSNNWCSKDITNSQESITDTLTSTSGYHQLINSSTHVTSISSSCTDLSFTSNRSLITEFGIENFLYTDSCHHITVISKMIPNVPFPPPYTSEVLGTIIKLTKKYSERHKNL